MACEYCEIIEGKRKAAKIYEDDKLVAFLSNRPAAIGHIVITPKKHLPIFEAADDSLVEHIFKTANKISIAVFESIKCEGTNLIINNGVEAGQEIPHLAVNIIARRNDDGIFFEWPIKSLGEEEMATVELKLKEELTQPEKPKEESKEEKKEEKRIEEPAQKPADKGTKQPDEQQKKEESEENYLIRQLRRMP